MSVNLYGWAKASRLRPLIELETKKSHIVRCEICLSTFVTVFIYVWGLLLLLSSNPFESTVTVVSVDDESLQNNQNILQGEFIPRSTTMIRMLTDEEAGLITDDVITTTQPIPMCGGDITTFFEYQSNHSCGNYLTGPPLNVAADGSFKDEDDDDTYNFINRRFAPLGNTPEESLLMCAGNGKTRTSLDRDQQGEYGGALMLVSNFALPSTCTYTLNRFYFLAASHHGEFEEKDFDNGRPKDYGLEFTRVTQFPANTITALQLRWTAETPIFEAIFPVKLHLKVVGTSHYELTSPFVPLLLQNHPNIAANIFDFSANGTLAGVVLISVLPEIEIVATNNGYLRALGEVGGLFNVVAGAAAGILLITRFYRKRKHLDGDDDADSVPLKVASIVT